MPRLPKALTIGLVTGVLGVLLIPFCHNLEENLGLGMLFKLRGPREAPTDVVIVTIDKLSADQLDLPAEPEKWPRSLHAGLTERLVNEGASVIVFDILFDEIREPADDRQFADAIRRAGNVVLCECLRTETLNLSDRGGDYRGHLLLERVEPPAEPFARSALALAPFPLPKVPVKVSQYWTIKAGAGDVPTLPVVAFQTFALQAHDEFVRLLEKIAPDVAEQVPHEKDTLINTKGIEEHVLLMRKLFGNNPAIPERILEALEEPEKTSIPVDKARILTSLTKLYLDGDSRYLNFYGPSGTIETVPYYQVLRSPPQGDDSDGGLDFRGKAVFIGFSEHLRPEQQDGFHTVFSQESGVDISGVEIAATAFANLVEDRPVRPLGLPGCFATALVWGVVLGLVCFFFSPLISAIGVIGISGLYLAAAHYQFKLTGMWYPLVIPLFIQGPLAFFGTVLWKYFRTHKERENIRKAFGYYLPDRVVDQVANNVSNIRDGGQIFYGTCLNTDAEQYTKLSERMGPKELSDFMNKYYEAIFTPIRQKGGIVSDVVGDSMLALWATPQPDMVVRSQACLAALEIARRVNQFSASASTIYLPTRIGLHSGEVLLGHVGAIDHYEYRPVGDIVATVSRIESLNKKLGTRILASNEVVYRIDGFLTREIGEFVLAGKSRPIVIHEIIASLDESNIQQRNLCDVFAQALDAYRRRSWDEAMDGFRAATQLNHQDGPSEFYLTQCRRYRERTPEEPWDAVISLSSK
jgi:adenylate cyclase